MKKQNIYALVATAFLVLPIFLTGQTSSVRTSGLKSTVTVTRDARSIPYIGAVNESDLYFAQGYVTASDRLWQMDLMRRVARGETAEIFGRATIEEDKRWRRFGFAQIAQESLQYLRPELRAALDSYAAGVNAYIATLDEKSLPAEFRILQFKPRSWVPADTIVIGKILADALSTTWRNDLLRATLRSVKPEKLAELEDQVTKYDVVLFGSDKRAAAANWNPKTAVPTDALLAASVTDSSLRKSSLERVGFYAEDLAASNNWVIAGKRTADGKAMLANDPHLQPTAPGIWYLTHLTSPAGRVSGVTIPGVPGIILGHNEWIAWGATNVGPDVQDLYVENFDEDGKYLTVDGKLSPITRKESIKFRPDPLKTDLESVDLDVIETKHGVVVTEDAGKKYALNWTARNPKNHEFEAFYFLNRARNWSDFQNALMSYGGATQNFVYADVKGNIGWYAAGRIPIRRKGDGGLPYDGSTNDGDWTESIPFADLPHLYNPDAGFIVTANQRIVGTDYKYPQMSRDAAAPWRARRIYDLLKANQKVTMDDVAAIQLDVYNIPLANLARALVDSKHEDLAVYTLIREWDGRMDPDSAAATVVNETRLCLANKIAEETKPVPAFLIRERVLDQAVTARSKLWLPKVFANYDVFFESCLKDASQGMTAKFGGDPKGWKWGNTFKARFPHPLVTVPFIGAQFATPAEPIAGSGQTPNVGSNVSMRHIASPGNWDLTRHVIPLGESGDPRSPFYKD
ncbi:MAG: penicillin acylase family protein, partial [Acidobacteriota bacterium]